MDATIACRCGRVGGWEEFAAGQGKWRCPGCGEAWGTRMVDAERAIRESPVLNRRKDTSGLTNHRVEDGVEKADCPICGAAYDVWKRNAVSICPRKTCGKTACRQAATTKGRRAWYSGEATKTAMVRVRTAAEKEMRWMADARMCPVV